MFSISEIENMVLRINLLALLLLSVCCLYFVGATEPDDNDYVTGIKEGDIEDDDDDEFKKSAKDEAIETAERVRLRNCILFFNLIYLMHLLDYLS